MNLACRQCGDDVAENRWELGHHLCLWCGEEAARAERKSWTVVQEYGKGNYGFVTAASARRVLLDTNQKNPRS